MGVHSVNNQNSEAARVDGAIKAAGTAHAAAEQAHDTLASIAAWVEALSVKVDGIDAALDVEMSELADRWGKRLGEAQYQLNDLDNRADEATRIAADLAKELRRADSDIMNTVFKFFNEHGTTLEALKIELAQTEERLRDRIEVVDYSATAEADNVARLENGHKLLVDKYVKLEGRPPYLAIMCAVVQIVLIALLWQKGVL